VQRPPPPVVRFVDLRSGSSTARQGSQGNFISVT
jgi:hypothetical protein